MLRKRFGLQSSGRICSFFCSLAADAKAKFKQILLYVDQLMHFQWCLSNSPAESMVNINTHGFQSLLSVKPI